MLATGIVRERWLERYQRGGGRGVWEVLPYPVRYMMHLGEEAVTPSIAIMELERQMRLVHLGRFMLTD